MDLESECSTRESVQDNVDVNAQLGNSPSSTAKTPSGITPLTTKGYGLKKWRRIPRDVVRDGSPEVDSDKGLKRGLPNSGKPLKFRTGEGSDGSVGSVNAFKGSSASPDSRYAIGSAFNGGGDSENSEDRSSRSSTAASVPKGSKGKFGSLVVKGKSLSGITQAQRSVESTKKLRGERVGVEKENSHSSMESDSRSENSLFMKGASSVNSNGKQSGQSMNFDGADRGEERVSGEKASYEKESLFEDLAQNDLAAGLSWEGKDEKSEKTEQDPLIDSILSLQLVQEALEQEIQKFGEVGKNLESVLGHPANNDASPADFTSTKIEAPELSSSIQNGSNFLKTHVLSLTESVKVLESKLEESRNMLEAKESRIAELEATFNMSRSPEEEYGSSMDLQQEKYAEFENELEGLFRQRIEAEVEYLAIIKTLQKIKIVAVDNEDLIKEQIALAGEQELMVDNLKKAETKAGMLKKQAAELEKSCEDIMGKEEVMMVQGKVCKATSCFFLQLILLLLFFWLFVLQLKPQSGAFIPT